MDGVTTDADGQAYLAIRVSAVPEEGKANKALIAFLAKSLKLPKSAIHLISGGTSRKKRLRIDGDPAAIVEKLKIFERL